MNQTKGPTILLSSPSLPVVAPADPFADIPQFSAEESEIVHDVMEPNDTVLTTDLPILPKNLPGDRSEHNLAGCQNSN